MGMATILVTWPRPFEQTLIPYHTEASHEKETYIPQPYFVFGANLRDEVRHTQTL